MESQLQHMARLLIARKIEFKLTDENQPRFVIFGKKFSIEDLRRLEREGKLQSFGLFEIAAAWRYRSTLANCGADAAS